MIELYQTSTNGMTMFQSIVDELGKANNMNTVYHSSVLDGTRRRIRKYYWVELRKEKYFSIPESISLFAEVGEDGKARYRVSVEIDERNANINQIEKHNSILNLPVKDEYKYALGRKAAGELLFVKNSAEAKNLICQEDYNKVQISVCVSYNQVKNNNNIGMILDEAIKSLVPFYLYTVE
ncbi:MAG TPA: hypothetical protein DCP07_02620 [Lachnospiraceae bacterium]|nr:hypothetical protein [Lachnospiraceae bacterium]